MTATVPAPVRVLRNLRTDGPPPALGGPTRVEVVDDLDAATALAPEWQELVAAAGTSSFTGPAYALAWWRHRGHGRLHIVAVRVGRRLVALAPLHVRRTAGLQVVRWLGHGFGSISEVLVRPGADAATAAVWEHLATVPHVLLDLVEYRGDGGGLLALRRSALQSSAVLRDVCPVVELDGLGSADRLIDRLPRKKGLYRSLKLAERTRCADGVAFAVRTATDPDAFRALLPGVDHVHDRAEADHPRLHVLRPPWRAFALEVLDAFLSAGTATVHLGTLDGRPATFLITVDDPGTTSAWLTRFDPAARRYAPGHLLMRHAVDTAIRRGAARVDLLLGDGRHKLPWATASYDTLTVRATARHLPARVAALDAAARAREIAATLPARLRRHVPGARG